MYGASNTVTGDKRNIVKALREIATMPRFNPLKLMNANKAVIGLNLLHWWDDRGLARGAHEAAARPPSTAAS